MTNRRKDIESFKRKIIKRADVQHRLIGGYRTGKGSVADIAVKSLVDNDKLNNLLFRNKEL